MVFHNNLQFTFLSLFKLNRYYKPFVQFFNIRVLEITQGKTYFLPMSKKISHTGVQHAEYGRLGHQGTESLHCTCYVPVLSKVQLRTTSSPSGLHSYMFLNVSFQPRGSDLSMEAREWGAPGTTY